MAQRPSGPSTCRSGRRSQGPLLPAGPGGVTARGRDWAAVMDRVLGPGAAGRTGRRLPSADVPAERRRRRTATGRWPGSREARCGGPARRQRRALGDPGGPGGLWRGARMPRRRRPPGSLRARGQRHAGIWSARRTSLRIARSGASSRWAGCRKGRRAITTGARRRALLDAPPARPEGGCSRRGLLRPGGSPAVGGDGHRRAVRPARDGAARQRPARGWCRPPVRLRGCRYGSTRSS